MYLQGLEDTGKGEDVFAGTRDQVKVRMYLQGLEDTGKGEMVFTGTRGYR